MEISHKIDNSALSPLFGDIDREIRETRHGHLCIVREGLYAKHMSALGSRSPNGQGEARAGKRATSE